MKVILLGYTSSIGISILEQLYKKRNFYIICVGRNTSKKPYMHNRIKYLKWNFLDFSPERLFFLKEADMIINCIGKIPGKNGCFVKINFCFVKHLVNAILKFKKRVRFIQLSSVSVFGANKKYLLKKISVTESFPTEPNNLYALSKLKADMYIKKTAFKNKKYFSYSILRITNVVGLKHESNLFSFLQFFLKHNLKFNYNSHVIYNFVHVKDVAQAVLLTLLNLNISKNKIYIVSNDELYTEIYKSYSELQKFIGIKIWLPKFFLKFFFLFFSYQSKIVKFLSAISSEISYDNSKIKKELGFNPKFSIKKFSK